MSYVKLEHRHLGDDRWLDLSPAAFTVHVWALDHCNEQATDGAIPKTRAVRLVCPVDPAEIPPAWAELIASELWAEEGDEYVCPDFTAHGIAAAEQNATRSKWAEDKRRQRLHAVGNHHLCTDRCKAKAAEVDSSPVVHQWTSGRSDQTRPDQNPKGSGSGRTAAEQRLGRPAHVWADDCCHLPASHPIHHADDGQRSA
ncbi:hypothetical protein [Nocardioides sp. MH1]|uniref:hypothetical protein n=1 Tax=Nocardioides sp. MH1 TaxID=3242490 RepID=UPI003520CAA3